MKKKILVLIPFILFAVIIISKSTYATNYDDKLMTYWIPDKYENGYSDIREQEVYRGFAGMNGNYQTEILTRAIKLHDIITVISQSEIDEYIKMIEDIYESDPFCTLKDVKGEIVEVNGVRGFRVTYNVYVNTTNMEYSHADYQFWSDSYEYSFNFSGDKYYKDSDEVKKIINSFKIRDTVIKSNGIPFTDVSRNSWYYNAVKFVNDNKIVSGYNAYTFAPYDKLTRGMLVTILWRMEGSPDNDGVSKFTDVDSKAWYAKAVKWAADNKIVSGYTGTTKFGPKDNILRQDLAGVLRNYAKYKGKNVNVTTDLTKFKDYKKISSYANESMQWAVGTGVISGNGNGTLDPKGNANRAEAAAMIQKYCNKVGQ